MGLIDVANEGLGMGVNALAEVFEKYAPENFKWKFEEYPDEIGHYRNIEVKFGAIYHNFGF